MIDLEFVGWMYRMNWWW